MRVLLIALLAAISYAQTDKAKCPQQCKDAWIGDKWCDEALCHRCSNFYDNFDVFDGGDCDGQSYEFSPMPWMKEAESAVSDGECQECASAYERDGGCTYALKGNWFQMMPNECYLKLHENARVNCRSKVIDHCISVGGDVKVAPQPSRNSVVAAKVMPNERCQECAAAYERDGGCQYALRGKWFKIRMPGECYLNVNEKSGADCRKEVIDHCRSVESAVSIEESSVSVEEVESALSDGDCQECADAYERDGGCKYALRGKWYKMQMPDECYLNANRKSRRDCRREVINHCRSIESAVSVDAVESAVSVGESVAFGGELESAVSRGQCKACALEYAEAGGCKYALKGKWFKIRMPDTCYLNVNSKSRRDCRREVINHCRSVESAVSVDVVESAISVDAEESAVSVGKAESVVFGGELESAVSRGQCKACALEYAEAGGCKYALKGKWFKIRMPDTCYLNVNSKSRRDCRREVVRHCKRFGITQSVLNYSMNIFAIIGFLALIYGFGTTYRTFTAKAEYDQIDDLEF